MVLVFNIIVVPSRICTSAFYLKIQTEVVSLGLSDCIAGENRHEQINPEDLEGTGRTSGLSKQLFTKRLYATFFHTN